MALDPDYVTAQLVARSRRLATEGPDAGSDLARAMLEICDRLEGAVEINLKLEEWTHNLVKATE